MQRLLRNQIILLTLFSQLTSVCHAQSDGYVIIGRVQGPGADSLNNAVLRGLTFPLDDTVPIRQGQFVFRGRVKKPGMVLVGTDKVRSGLGMWLSNDTIRATFQVTDHGGGLHLLQPIAMAGPTESVDYLAHLTSSNEYNSAHKDRQERTQYVAELVGTYVQAHPNSPYTLHLLSTRSDMIGPGLSRNLLDNLAPALRNSEDGESVSRQIHTAETLILGKSISTFSLPDQQGVRQQVAVSDKPFTLLSFWASWCGPCRTHNKELVRLYRQSNPDDVRMVSISLDDDKAAWIKAIQKDGLTWEQLADMKGWGSPELKQFALSSIPQTILLDKNNQIVAITDADIRRLLGAK